MKSLKKFNIKFNRKINRKSNRKNKQKGGVLSRVIWQDEIDVNPKSMIQGLSWSPNGFILACISYKKEIIKLWYPNENIFRDLIHEISEDFITKPYISWSPDSKLLASCCSDFIILSNIETQEYKQKKIKLATGIVFLSWFGKVLSNGNMLLSIITLNNIIIIFSINQSCESQIIKIIEPTLIIPKITSMLWLNTNRKENQINILYGGENKLQSYNILSDPSSKQLLQIEENEEKGFSEIESMICSPNEKYLVIADTNRSIYIYELENNIYKYKRIVSNNVEFLKNNNNNNLYQSFEHTDSINCLVWKPNTNIFSSCSSDGTIKLWDISDLKEHSLLIDILSYTPKPKKGFASISWSPDGNFLASGSNDGIIRMWDFTKEKQKILAIKALTLRQRQLKKSPNSTHKSKTPRLPDELWGYLTNEFLEHHKKINSKEYSKKLNSIRNPQNNENVN